MIFLIVLCLLYFFGNRTYAIALVTMYGILIPAMYFVERKKRLSLLQKRILVTFIVFPTLVFFLPVNKVIALFIGSVTAGFIIMLIEKNKDRKSEVHEDSSASEGEDKDKDKNR
jgi:hypothetical protein